MNEHFWNRYKKFIELCDGQTHSDEYFYEKHHIIPKSLGGDNSADNLIKLTPRQHFIAHYILSKAIPCRQTWLSVQAMSMKWSFTSKEIEIARICNSLANRGENNPMFGKTLSGEAKEKIRNKLRGRPLPKETKQKISKALVGRKTSEETKKKISIANSGRKPSEAVIQKMRESHLGKTLPNKQKEKISKNNPNTNKEVFNFFHNEYGLFRGMICELRRRFPEQKLTSGGLHKVVKGQQEKHKGWFIK